MQTTEGHQTPWNSVRGLWHVVTMHVPLLRRVMRMPILDRVRVAVAERAIAGNPDRIYMETVILPTLANDRFRRVLFVGCRRYTRGYGRWFTSRAIEYWTTDIDPKARRWGEPRRHVTADVRDLSQHFAPGGFDLVLLNGVFGFGVDDTASMNTTLDVLHALIAPKGVLMVGWNFGLIADPAGLARMRALFQPTTIPPLPHRKAFADMVGHVYDFYQAA
jgi:hypothetical protein